MKHSSIFRSLAGIAMLALAVLGVLYAIAHPHPADPGGLALIGLGGIIVNRENLNSMYTGFKTAFQGAFSGVTPTWSQTAPG